MEVKIYTEVAFGGPGRQSFYAAIIEFVTASGKKVTRTVSGKAQEAYHHLILIALVEAMMLLTKPCFITAFVKSDYIENMIGRGLPGIWKQKNWTNSKGDPVASAKYWDRLLEMSYQHTLTFIKAAEHEYTQELQLRIKELRREKKDEDYSSG